MGLKARIVAGWSRPGALAVALLPLGLLFALVAGARRRLYASGALRSVRLAVPVVVAGNITVGGSGKTPLVLWLADALRARGYQPGIVSRGYGGTERGPSAVAVGDEPARVGDEPLLLARRSGCPVWIGRDRAAAARSLLAANPGCNLILADDGLQHYRLARDFEIAVVDRRGLGNGWPLPAGPLRELPGRLAQVDAVVLHDADASMLQGRVAPSRIHSMHLEGARFESLLDPTRHATAGEFAAATVHAVAGIGEPQRFFDHLAALGLRFTPHAFADHHPYRAADLAFAGADAILMTEKDAVKCASFAPGHAWVLRVEAVIAPDLARAVAERIDGRPPA
ncbi:MAG: tetraacyldisaccharide 4'-kinase [Betaproteobacteria bacterium]|nr:tetraacyldisaccharide 4'-kinase [Betaproteobacteria bacterium]